MPLVNLSGLISNQKAIQASAVPNSISSALDPLTWVILTFYGIVCLALMVRFALRLNNIRKLVDKGTVIRKDDFYVVLLPELKHSFSFLNYIFIRPEIQDSEIIFRHEMVHVKQGHSADNLFIELIQVFCWFNPVLHMIKTDLKLVHEYIADKISTTSALNKSDYALFLISHTYGIPPDNLGSNMFNQSLLKQRIMKLNQKKSAGWIQVKYLLAVLLIPIMMGLSAMTFVKNYGITLQDEHSVQDTITQLPPPPPVPAIETSSATKLLPPPPPVEKRGGFKSKQKAPPPPVSGKGQNKNDNEAPPPPPQPPVDDGRVSRVTFPPPIIKGSSAASPEKTNAPAQAAKTQ